MADLAGTMGEGPFFDASADFLPLDLTEIDAGVYSTPLLTEAACRRLLEHTDAKRARLDLTGAMPPNSMHDYGVGLEDLSMTSLTDELLDAHGALRAAIAERFDGVGGASIDHHHSYFVDYRSDRDEDLGFHVDDSEVTLNLCLGDSFRGAELVMMGRRCEVHRQSPVGAGERFEIDHEPGVLILHAGSHRHQVEPILRGRRRNLIAWLRSSAYRGEITRTSSSACPSWCGYSPR